MLFLLYYCWTRKRSPSASKLFVLGRPERSDPDGLLFYRRCFLGSHISEVPRPIAPKLCHMIGIWLKRSRKFQKFGGLSPKNIGAKNMQTFGQFFATSDFDREYLRNGLRYTNQKGTFSISIPPSCVLRNRPRELWSTNSRDLDGRLDPLKCTFLGYYISALRGCCALKFLHAVEIDQRYLAHTPSGTGVPKKF